MRYARGKKLPRRKPNGCAVPPLNRAQLLEQFSRILETRDTARGLVVNMADVLFDTGKYHPLRPAREKLARLAVSSLLIRVWIPKSWARRPSLSKLPSRGHRPSRFPLAFTERPGV